MGFLRDSPKGRRSRDVYVCVSSCVRVCCSHGATLVLGCVGVFETKSLLRSIFLQVGELFTVDGSSTLPAKQNQKKAATVEINGDPQ